MSEVRLRMGDQEQDAVRELPQLPPKDPKRRIKELEKKIREIKNEMSRNSNKNNKLLKSGKPFDRIIQRENDRLTKEIKPLVIELNRMKGVTIRYI